LKPALKAVGFECVRADEIHGPQVMGDIWNSIWRAKLVIADVTGKNPNVNYELGLCHALGVPTIIVTQDKKHVPFDYVHHRYIVYRPGKRGWRQKLKTELLESLNAALVDSSGRGNILVWPSGVKIVHGPPRPAKITLPVRRSVLLDYPRVPFRGGQNADFFKERLPRGARGFTLKITVPDQAYWRCGFVLSPEDYIHDGHADIEILRYFLFHFWQGKPTTPTTPPQKTGLAWQAYDAGSSVGQATLQLSSSLGLRAEFGQRRRTLSVYVGEQLVLEREMERAHLKYLYVLAWADYYPAVRVPVDLEIR